MEQKPVVIDITPLWVGILPALLAALENGTEEGKRMARDELKHMAQVADLAKDATGQRDELLSALVESRRIVSESLPSFGDDHSVGVCNCDMIRSIDVSNAIIAKVIGEQS